MSRAEAPTDDSTAVYRNIPDELKARKQWLLWSTEKGKQPLNEHGCGASWTDSDEFLSFEDARDRAESSPQFDGIGFVVSDSDPYTVLDLDGCLREPNEAKPEAWIRDIGGIEPFTDTWGQFSQSGTGAHIYIKNQPLPDDPDGWKWSNQTLDSDEHKGVEAYEQKFMIITGRQIPGFADTVSDIGESAFRDFLFNAQTKISGAAPRAGITDAGSSTSDEWLTEADIKDALAYIDPDLPHGDWIQIGYAVHDFDSGNTGKRLFEEWSQGGSKYDSAAKRSIESLWSNANQGSGVSVATLVHKAKENGWEPRPDVGNPTATDEHTVDTPFIEAVDSNWFDPARKTVLVGDTAEYHKEELAERIDDPDKLSTDEILAINELDGGAEFLANPEEWQVQIRTYDPLADLSAQEIKNLALRDIPAERIAYLPTREEWFWCDEHGVWDRHGEEDIRQWLDNYLGEHYRRSIRTEVQDQLKARVRAQEEVFGGGPNGWIATRSGLVNLESGEYRDIEPGDHVRWQLGTEYDPSAECPEWKAFLGDVAEPDDIPMLQEFVGYCLHHWGLPYKKALIIFGPTDAGKSVFLDVVRALFGGHGSSATSSTSVQYLANERWGPARLVNTAVNIRNDLDSSTIENTGKVKELIAGDALDAERKKKPVFKFSPTSKHMFAANRAPDRNVDDEAFWNRWLTVMFPESVPRHEQDPELQDRLLAELPGILNWAIEGYRRLTEQGAFTNEPLPFKNREKWERFGNSIEQWLNEFTEEQSDGFVPKWTTDDGTLGAYDSYKAFARQSGLECEADAAFTSKLKRREGIQKARRTVDGAQVWGYAGFTLAEDAPEPDREPEQRGESHEATDPSGLHHFEGESKE